jgi:hypothetical protein
MFEDGTGDHKGRPYKAVVAGKGLMFMVEVGYRGKVAHTISREAFPL